MRWLRRLGARTLAASALAVWLDNGCGGGASDLGGSGGFAQDAGADQVTDQSLPPDVASDGAAVSDAPDAVDSQDASDEADAADTGDEDAAVSPACEPMTVELGPWTFDHAFAADGTNVYFTVSSGGQTRVKAWAKSGGGVTELVVIDAAVSALAANGTAVYALTRGSPTEDGALLAFQLPAGPIVTLASAPGPFESLTIDSKQAYVARRSNSGAVLRVALGGGPFVPLATGVSQPWKLALNANALFWLSYDNDSAVWTLSKAGGTVSVVMSGVGRYAVDEKNIYYSQGGYVRVRALGGGTPWTLAQESPQRIFVDGDELYFKAECGVSKVAKVGGPAVGVAAPTPCSSGDESFAVDDACVYFMHASWSLGPPPDSGNMWTVYLDRFPK